MLIKINNDLLKVDNGAAVKRIDLADSDNATIKTAVDNLIAKINTKYKDAAKELTRSEQLQVNKSKIDAEIAKL